MKIPPTLPVASPLEDGIHWILQRDLSVLTDDGLKWKVPAGFVTDFASSRIFRFNLLTYRTTYSAAAIFHDYLYATGKVTRLRADMYFRSLVARGGSTRYNELKAYYGVRLFGWFAWSKHRKNDIKPA